MSSSLSPPGGRLLDEARGGRQVTPPPTDPILARLSLYGRPLMRLFIHPHEGQTYSRMVTAMELTTQP